LIIGGIILGVVIIAALILGTVSGWQYGGWGMMGPGMMGGFGWMWLMPVLWIVVLGLIIWVVVASVRSSSESRDSDSSKTASALEVLKRRYARGEIDKLEYEEKKKDLI
jgi:putative membrane protein